MLTRDQLDALYHTATGNGPSRDRPILWAAETLEVSRRTVTRWVAGETSPTTRQLVRLRVAARAAELGREGWWTALRSLLARDLEEPVRDRLEDELARARRDEALFQRGHPGGEFAVRDQLPGSPRAHMYHNRGRRRR